MKEDHHLQLQVGDMQAYKRVNEQFADKILEAARRWENGFQQKEERSKSNGLHPNSDGLHPNAVTAI